MGFGGWVLVIGLRVWSWRSVLAFGLGVSSWNFVFNFGLGARTRVIVQVGKGGATIIEDRPPRPAIKTANEAPTPRPNAKTKREGRIPRPNGKTNHQHPFPIPQSYRATILFAICSLQGSALSARFGAVLDTVGTCVQRLKTRLGSSYTKVAVFV
jgi:hypothetical protein